MLTALYPLSGSPVSTAQILNVKDYGAVGDGTTDDGLAIKNAINAAKAAGVSGRGVDLWFPSGVYYVNSNTPFPYLNTNIRIRGSGWQSTVILCNITTGDLFQIGNGSAGPAGNSITDISLWHTGATTSGSTINVNLASDTIIENVVLNNYFTGVTVQGASIKCWLRRVEFNNGHAADGIGVAVNNGAAGDTYLMDCVASNNPASKPLVGVQMVASGHCSIIRCNFTSFLTGISCNPSATAITYLFIDHTLFDSCGTYGADFSPTSTGTVKSVMCVNSWFSGTTTGTAFGIRFNGVNAAAVDAASFIGCRILNNQQHGVSLGLSQNVSFTDCTIAGNGQATSNTYDGISIAANVSNVLVEGCKIGQAGTAANQQRYAINVVAGTSANLVFVNNDCEPNGTLGNNGYINLGALTGGGNIVENNAPMISITFGDARTAATSAFTTTETILTPAVATDNRLMASGFRAGTTLRFTIWGTSTISTAAGTAQFRVRIGTNNSTGDTAVLDSGAFATGGVGGPIAFRITVTMTIRSLGASAAVSGVYDITCDSATGGIAAAITRVINGTAATFASTGAVYVNITGVGSANCSITVQGCSMEVANT
jgi:hypothetical protein